MNAPCEPGLMRFSKVNHAQLRTLTKDGRCPICDPGVSREEYIAIVLMVARDPVLREKVMVKGTRGREGPTSIGEGGTQDV